MTGRQRTGKRVTTQTPIQATDRREAQRVPVQLMAAFQQQIASNILAMG